MEWILGPAKATAFIQMLLATVKLCLDQTWTYLQAAARSKESAQKMTIICFLKTWCEVSSNVDDGDCFAEPDVNMYM